MKIQVGTYPGTSVSFVNGTKVFTITGLTGLLTAKRRIKNAYIIRGTAVLPIFAPATKNYTLTASGNDYIVDFSATTTAPALAVGDELVVECEIPDRELDILAAISGVQSSVNALSPVSWSRQLNVNAGSIAYFYANQPININAIALSVGNVTEIRRVNASGNEEILPLPFTVNPGMGVKVYTNNSVSFTCTLSGSKTSDSATIIQNQPLSANPYPGLPCVGHCIWDVENTKMIITENICITNNGLNVGIYENDGKIVQEFETRMAIFKDTMYSIQNITAVNTPNFYYIQYTAGMIWYNKTTKDYGVHLGPNGAGFIYIPSKNKIVCSAHTANLYVIDCTTNVMSTITTTINNTNNLLYCSSIDRVVVGNAGASSIGFVNIDALVQDGANISVSTASVMFCLSENGNSLYVVNGVNTSCHKIKLSDRVVTNFTATNITGATSKLPIEKNGFIYILCADNRTWVGNASTLAFVKFIANTTGIYGGLVDGNKIWVTNYLGAGAGLVNYLDLSTETTGVPVSVNNLPRFLVKHPQTGQIYVGCIDNQNGLSIVTP